MKSIIFALVLCAVLVSQGVCSPSVEKFNGKSQINWTDLIYTATGEGVMPSPVDEPNRAKAYLKAKGYARMQAIANLLQAIEGTTISFEATGKDYMEDAVIRQRIEGYVKNVEVVDERKEKFEGDTMVVVTVRAPMYGQYSPGSVLLDQALTQPAAAAEVNVTLDPDIKPSKVEIDQPVTVCPSTEGKPYTSVIFDATGYKLDRCMSPKIRRGDGSEVWGTVKVDHDFVLERGICSYATSMTDAKNNARAGENPMVVRAIGRAGGRFNSDPVISDADSAALLAENAKSGFLDKLNVIIIKDGRL
ncbi:MAG: hypothetical protein ABFD49_03170 [Armatimonadota bacterium]|nr:hypothetical protein [bacterium]